MAKGRIEGITIKITGETEGLAQSLTNINKEIKETQFALNDVKRALKLDPNNVELLEQKQNLLNKQIEQTEEKLNLEKEAAEKAKEALELGNITSEEYAQLQSELVKTENALNKLNAEANESGIEKTGNDAKTAGEKVDDASGSFERFGDAARVAGEVAAVAFAAVTTAIVSGTTALANMTVESASFADEMLTTSAITGIGVDRVQAFAYASELLDVSTETVTSTLSRMIRQVGSAADAVDFSSTAFAQLGVDIRDSNGELRDSEGIYWETIEALGAIANETERDAIAMEIFGRSAMELNPLIQAGAETFNELAAEAEAAGYILSGDQLADFGDFDDQIQRLQVGAEAARHSLGFVLLPILTQLAGEGTSLLNEFTNQMNATGGDLNQIEGVVESLVPQALAIIDTYLPVVLSTGGTIVSALLEGVLSNLDSILLTASDLLMTLASGLISALPTLASAAITLVSDLVSFILDPQNLNMIITTAVDIVVTLATSLAESAPELIPAVLTAIMTIATSLLDNIDELVVAAFELTLGIAEGLILAIPDIVGQIPSLIAAILGAFADLGPRLGSAALEWGSDLIDNLVSGITNMIPNLIDGVTEIAGVISDFLHFSVPEKGPLADFDSTMGEHLVGNIIEGIESESRALEASVLTSAQIIQSGYNQDYSGVLGNIASSVNRETGPQIINVYLGQTKLGSVVLNAQNVENYRSGGI